MISTRTMTEDHRAKHKNNANGSANHNNKENEVLKHKNDAK